MDLASCRPGRPLRVVELTADGRERRRLTELGVHRGAVVEVVRRAPFGGPIALRVGGGLLALRPGNARRVIVEEHDGG